MKLLIVLIVAFLIVVYVFTYIKHKKRKNKDLNVVKEYREKYVDKKVKSKKVIDASAYTKYKSAVDYIDKDELLRPPK